MNDRDYWLFMLLELLLIPGIMIILGRSFMKKPPKNKNSFFGYRTTRAQLNQETWEFAHRYIGRIWFWLGIITAVATAVAILMVIDMGPQTISTVAGCAVLIHLFPLILPVIPTELALKKHFDEFGNRII